MSTETPVGVVIPQAARAAWEAAAREDGLRGAGAFITAPLAVRAAAPIIVAAELRRLADEFPGNGSIWVRGHLRARADVLDPPATEEGP